MRFVIVTSIVVVLIGVTPAVADIFNNGIPNLDIGPWSDFDAELVVADDFTLTQNAATVSDLHWWGYYSGDNSPGIDDFYVYFFEDAGMQPTNEPFIAIGLGDVGRTDTGMEVVGQTAGATFDLYEYSVNFIPIGFVPGDVYWIAIVNNTADDMNDNWAWAPSANEGNAHWLPLDEDPSWRQYSQELAFYLTNDPVVPEPASAGLLLLGLAALVARNRRRIL